MQRYGTQWFDALLAQNPRWVRGTATPATLLLSPNSSYAVTFSSSVGWEPVDGLTSVLPTDAQLVSWAQTAAITRNAPHPEGAKLLHNFILDPEYQAASGWPVRRDVELDPAFPFPPLDEVKTTNAPSFNRWMEDRSRVERLRFWFERRIGSAQGASPLEDDL